MSQFHKLTTVDSKYKSPTLIPHKNSQLFELSASNELRLGDVGGFAPSQKNVPGHMGTDLESGTKAFKEIISE